MADPTPTTDAFIYKDVPATPQEQMESSVTEYSTRVAKGALLAYFKEFIDGRFQYVMKNLSPYILTLTADSMPAQPDPEKRYVMLARRMALLYQKLPVIMVVDAGTNLIQPGLGSFDRVEIRADGTKMARQNRILEIPMDVIVGATQEDPCDDIAEGVLTMLENRTLVGSTLYGENWTLLLPLAYQYGPRTVQPVPDDSTRVFAMRTLSFTVRFETWYYHALAAEQPLDLRGMGCGPRPAHRLEYPRQVRINQTGIHLMPFNYPVGTIFRSDKPSVAIITPDLSIAPVSIGTCRILAVGPGTTFREEYPLTITL